MEILDLKKNIKKLELDNLSDRWSISQKKFSELENMSIGKSLNGKA